MAKSRASAESAIEAVAFWLGVVLAILVRLELLSFESGDFQLYTRGWYDFVRQHGAVEALRTGLTNYTPPYVYGMAIVQWLLPSVAPVVALKLIALPFDFVTAWLVGRIVALRYEGSLPRRLATLAVLFAPTVVLNSAFWGQVDVVCTCGIVAFLYFVLIEQPVAAIAILGLALSFKLQAIFVAPLALILTLRGRVPWHLWFIAPAAYVAAMLPAWFSGRSLWDLLLVYAGQAEYYARLSSNAPHVFQWIPNDFYEYFKRAGLWWASGVLLGLTLAALHVTRSLSRERIVYLALLSVLWVPYLLPKMHERYFFAADVLSIVFAFYFPRLAAVPVAIVAASFFSYSPFLFHFVPIPVPIVALGQGLTALFLARDYVVRFRN